MRIGSAVINSVSVHTRGRWLFTVLFLLVVAGCAETSAPEGGSSPSAAPAPSLPATSPATPSPPAPGVTPSGSDVPAPSSPSAPATATSKPAPAGGELISVSKSGGFAGLADTVTVRADGTWTRTSRRTAERTGRLSGAQLSRLRTLAADPRLSTESAGGKSGKCSDAFTYAVVTAGHRIRYEDCPGQGTRPEATLTLANYVLDATKP